MHKKKASVPSSLPIIPPNERHTPLSRVAPPTIPAPPSPSPILIEAVIATPLPRPALRHLAALDNMAHARSAPGEARELRVGTQVVRVGAGVGVARVQLVLRVAVAGFLLVFCFFACGRGELLVLPTKKMIKGKV